MAFTLEDGTGVTSANAYVSETDVTTYLTDRGRETENSWSTLTTAQQQEAIVRATDYIEKVFGLRWKGYRNSDTQGLGWPRTGAQGRDQWYYASNAIPTKLQHATAEYAVRAAASATADLMPDPTVDASGFDILKEQVGPIVTEYASGSQGLIKSYPAADKLLADLTTGQGSRAIR